MVHRSTGAECTSCASRFRSGLGVGATAVRGTRLLAVDLDGTLVKDDGTIDPRDVSAVQRAAEAGVVVTIATGRLAHGALGPARALAVDLPMICADGAALVCAHAGLLLEEEAIAPAAVDRLLERLAGRKVAPFVFRYDGAHGEPAEDRFGGYVIGWASRLVTHGRLSEALDGWPGDGGILSVLGIGSRDEVEKARAELDFDHAEQLEVGTFCLAGSDWAVRAQKRSASKGACLARLAARLGIAREDVAAVGDWYNDLTMFGWAGRSFAMGQAPEEVRLAASDTLSATARTGGGVAEALARWVDL